MIENDLNPQQSEPLLEPGDHPIPTNWITRSDLAYCRPDQREKIRRLDVADMQAIATKIGDSLLETYWVTMGVVLDEYLKSNEEDQEAP